ncbi:5457_t:CDS:1, partial [Entrophospora sp. SA101]
NSIKTNNFQPKITLSEKLMPSRIVLVTFVNSWLAQELKKVILLVSYNLDNTS